MGIYLRNLSADSTVTVAKFVAFLTHHCHHSAKQNLRVYSLILVAFNGREVITYIPHIGCTEQGVTQCVKARALKTAAAPIAKSPA